jgi:hypothetical protein
MADYTGWIQCMPERISPYPARYLWQSHRKIPFTGRDPALWIAEMKSALHILLAFCVFAGLANGMVHKGLHDSHDECAAQHSHDAGGTHGDHDHDGDAGGSGEKDAPHHHDCCHFPSADFALGGVSAMITFQPILVEIPTDVSLSPEEPVFALDKPPLI